MKGLKGFMRLLMMLRSVNINFNTRAGTVLPGFMPRPFLFGMDSSFAAPGLDFLLGSQDIGIKERMAENNWLARSEFLTFPFTQYNTTDFKITGIIEPFRDFRIQFAASKSENADYQEIFRYGADTLDDGTVIRSAQSLSPTRTGNYNITVITIATSFIGEDADKNSPVFEKFEEFRHTIRDRLNAQFPSAEYNENSQDVIIPAFIAAYSSRDPARIGLTSFPKFPLPNWRIDYAGLGKIPALQEIFSSFSITHSYSSAYSINNYANSLYYEDFIDLNNPIGEFRPGSILNDNGESVPVYVIGQVSISERFAPLIGLNFRTKNKLTGRVEYKIERNLTLNISNAQVSELNSSDISFDIGYTQSNLKLPFKVEGETVVLKNDIQFRLNFTIRDTRTIQRKIEDDDIVTAGNINYQLRPTIQYMLNDRLSAQMYFERNINSPWISSNFKRSTTAMGVQVRFSLAQ
jgi:cell surface protein SprA